MTRVLSEYAGKKIAVGVSGGRDSMCLLHAVLSCGVADKSDVTAVHVNHKLRDAADGDEAFVREKCAAAGVRFLSYAVDVKRACETSSLSVEQAARELRYGVFRSVVESGAADIVFTAHHALDNAESVLMHMFRGSGLDGLCGISEKSGYTVRPLVHVYPDELDAYARENNIDYVVDETNFAVDADRNFIRLNVLPVILRRYGGAVRAVNALADEARGACAVLDGGLDPELIVYDCGVVSIKDEALFSPLAARYVRRALRFFSLTDATRDMIDRTAELVGMRTGATVPLNNGVAAVREYGCVTLHIPRERCTAEKPLSLGVNRIGGLAVEVKQCDCDVRTARCAVDLDKLKGATVRFRRDGDRFTPFGGGSKKLKQYFTDRKICRRVRDRIPLVCRGDEVLVVVGVQISEHVKVDGDTVRKGVVVLRNE